ncbi:MAG: sulfite exporter TauE/SafE family protein [Stappiaceae bacterium]
MDLSLSFYLVAASAVLLTGLSKSGFGGGLGVMSVPLMSLFISPHLAVAVLMPVLLTMDIIIVWQYRHRWNRAVVRTMLPGALFGLCLGALMFRAMDADLIRLFIGVLALFFVVQYVLQNRRAAESAGFGRPTIFAIGTVSGFASFIAHAGGPPVKGFLLSRQMEKSIFVGTNTMFFFAMNALKTVAYGAMGQMTGESLTISLTIAPMLLLGIWLGTRLHRLIDQGTFTHIVYGFLTIAGVKLVWDGMEGFW